MFGISEANFKKSHDIEDVKIENYDIYFSKTLDNPAINASRIAVYVHEDLQNQNFSMPGLQRMTILRSTGQHISKYKQSACKMASVSRTMGNRFK